MKFTLNKPCPKCPFRNDIDGHLSGDRMEEIVDVLFADGTFSCHKTTIEDPASEGDMYDGPDTQHCAGALIFLEHQDRPNQMMRIAERMGFYDKTKLHMDAPVFDDGESLIEHHAEGSGR